MTQRDWQKDMESCLKLKERHENDWMTGTEEGTGIWIIHEVMPDEPCQYVAECENELVVDFIMTAHEALPYWLQEAKERGEREQEIKRAIGRCLVAGNSLGSIIMNYNLPEGHEEWSFQEANSYFFGKFYNDRPSAYESYETWIAWKAIMGASEIMSTLYPDTPAPKEGD